MDMVNIYLSGSIKKGKSDLRNTFWTDDDMDKIQNILASKYVVNFLNPAIRTDDLTDFAATFGRDLFQVYCSNIVLVDARDHRGLGIGSEMTFAKANSIPVISIAPINSFYNKNDFEYLGQYIGHWIHPFISELSDIVVNSVEESAYLILNEYPFKQENIKGNSLFYNRMKHYINTQLKRDQGMNEIALNNDYVMSKIQELNKE